jgi:UDP-GlcNAc:undecaprenyl-phosphate GlcNAc-1-phosphate transferase
VRRGGRVVAAVAGAGLARGYLTWLRARPPGGPSRWEQENYAGRMVSRIGGPAHALGVLTATQVVRGDRRARAAATVAICTAGVVGVYDDLAGDTSARGLAGHGAELAAGRLTTGSVKVLGLAVGGLCAGRFLHRNWRDSATAGVVIAGCANLGNLLDLRPGRAIKSALAAGSFGLRGPASEPVGAALGAAAALLPDDLGERVMLGDAGAGALGAVVGVGLTAGASRSRLRTLLAAVVALNVASEFVSFSAVIERVPVLRLLDRVGGRHH